VAKNETTRIPLTGAKNRHVTCATLLHPARAVPYGEQMLRRPSLPFLLLLGACNAADGPSGPLPAGHVRGTIELDTRTSSLVAPVPPDPSDVRVGLAWFAEPGDPAQRPWVLQNVPIVSHSDSWPMEFELDITEPPPPGAIHYQLGYSQAKFVAYRDNGNGSLDWTPIAADAFIDSVVAYHPHLALWFFDDGGLQLMLPDGGGALSPPDTPITLLERSDERSSCHLLDWLPRFSFQASRFSYPDPDEGDQGPWDVFTFPACPADALPPPGATVACEPSGTASQYQYYASWTTSEASAHVRDTCGPLMRVCEGRRADPQAPGPWPCPCDPAVYTCVDYQLGI